MAECFVSKNIGRPLLFVGGDLSGIQKFLYNITSKRASVSLRGRSQYLVDFTREVLDDLTKLVYDKKNADNSKENTHIELIAQCNEEIYCSGGKFYWIVDDTADIRAMIDEVAMQKERDLWYEHFGQLALHIAYVPFRFCEKEGAKEMVEIDNKKYGIGELWNKANMKFAECKAHRFGNMVTKHYGELFGIRQVSSKAEVCAVTGVESKGLVPLPLLNGVEDNDTMVLKSVREQIEIGMELQRREVFKTFEDYAKDSYLGVLRMDVDGLGTRFTKGFDTMQAYMDFSETLTDFFEKRIRELRNDDEFKDYVLIVYAGGDDLFAVGRWDKVVDFAAVVHDELEKFLPNEGITISGGMVVVDGKFPIAKSAELSGEAEEKAKDFPKSAKLFGDVEVKENAEKYEQYEKRKNAFCLFDVAFSWDGEFGFVKEYKDDFVYYVEHENLPTSILHKLMELNEVRRRGEMRYVWNTAYYMTRFAKDKRDSVKCFCKNLEHDLYQGARNYELIALAARWAELVLRKI